MRTLLSLAVALVLAAPFTLADPSPANPGIPVACENSGSGPCKFLGGGGGGSNVIPETNVTTTQTYENGDFVGEGTVVVKTGATARFHNATVTWLNSSHGVLVEAGGTLVMDTTTNVDGGGSPFQIVAQPGSTLTLITSTIQGGAGVVVQTSAVDLRENRFDGIQDVPALQLIGVTATIHHNVFANGDLGVYQNGGQPTLQHNRFEYTHECIRDYETDPTIIDNVFFHCIIGIWHERSHSYIGRNDMLEDADPPSTGIVVIDGRSPVIEDNSITNFNRGIVIVNATAYVRNNTIFGNVAHGIFVDDNADPMDIQGNDIYGNGGDGIHIVNSTLALELFGNRVRDNAGTGIVIASSTGTTLTGDSATGNANGIKVFRSQATLRGVNASGNAGTGIHVDAEELLLGTSIDCVRAIGNADYGVLNLRGLKNATRGWYQGNAIAGVSTGESLQAVVDARNSYWGAANGPKPTGSGDAIQGQVLFFPFATSPPNATTCPTG